ncbi:MAG: AMP-binding protein [Actinobacteria bacterium]|nr:AMP-binding protein [Actinomycetota bacterium]
MEHNIASVFEAVESAVKDRPCIVCDTQVLTYREFGDRSRQFANVLLDAGLGRSTPRSELADHESGQDHVAVYLHNSAEYLEVMLGAFAARVVPFNVNYRYVAEELEYLLCDAGTRGVVYHSAFAPVMAEVRDRLVDLELLLQVDDGSGVDLLPGAEWYHTARDARPTQIDPAVRAARCPDDLYLLYTGGTTGRPKGVLWRQADIFVTSLGGRRRDDATEWAALSDIAGAAADHHTSVMPASPFMHGAAHWLAFSALTNGDTVVIGSNFEHFDADALLDSVEEHDVEVLLIVGDAFGRPLADALERRDHEVSSLLAIVSGGAALSTGVAERLLAAAPSAVLLDGLGASESGQQASRVSTVGSVRNDRYFIPMTTAVVLDDGLEAVAEPGHDGIGWLAQTGRIPLGYLGDAERSAATFPSIDGVRYAVPGDRVRRLRDGSIELLGRDAATINTGGEKVFAEEVEQALLQHPAVVDCVVVGRPSLRWGDEVVAVVQLRSGDDPSDEELLAEAGRHVARFKLPKALLRCEAMVRSPSGKADYRWARAQAVGA